MEKFRGTGRTTRMLEYAVSCANRGKNVIIYCQTGQMRHLKSQLANMVAMFPVRNKTHTMKFPVGEGSILLSVIDRKFDWHRLIGYSVSSDTITLVDHYALEQQYPLVTRMLYQFMETHAEGRGEQCS